MKPRRIAHAMSRNRLPRPAAPALALPLLLVACGLLGSAGGAAAQFPPEELKNLQILPKDIGIQELIATMRGFAGALGTRCHYCHVGEAGQPLSTYDFASDEKPTKRTARVMLRMVQDVNRRLASELGKEPPARVEVRCETCHRGLNRPVFLEDVLSQELADKGVEATVARYRELRERYHGSHSYNFKDWVLSGLAGDLARAGKTDDALTLLALALEFHPQSSDVYATRAEVHRQRGDRAQAIADLEKAMALNAEMAPFLRPRLDQLKAEAEADPEGRP